MTNIDGASTSAPVRIEQGVKLFHKHGRCLVLAENEPVWITATRLSEWDKILCLGLDLRSWKADSFWAAFVERLEARIETVEIGAISSGAVPISLVLISGSQRFLSDWASAIPSTIPCVALLETQTRKRGRLRIPGFETWHELPHSRVGGTSMYKAVFGIRGIPRWKIPVSVSRSLGHILDHGIKPNYLSGPDRVLTTCYREGDRLPVRADKATPIAYPTRWCRSGWGMRSLTVAELGLCYDLPLFITKNAVLLGSWNLKSGNKTTSTFPPLKLLQTVLDATLVSLAGTVTSPSSVPLDTTPTAPVSSAEEGSSLIPSLGRRLDHGWLKQELVEFKAAKCDDAAVPTSTWDLRVSPLFPAFSTPVLESLRRLAHRWWTRHTYCALRHHLRWRHGALWEVKLALARQDRRVLQAASPQQKALFEASTGGVLHRFPFLSSCTELLADAEAGCAALAQNVWSSWWGWDYGSSLCFWRWGPQAQRKDARDGMEIFVKGTLPTYTKAPRRPQIEMLARVRAKLSKVRQRRYIQFGLVRSLTDYFPVPKGTDDIRMVYNGTSSGLNAALWAPGFWLPTSETALRFLTYYSYAVDIDLGEMFLNFPMDPKIRPYAGVDLTGMVDGDDDADSPGDPNKPKPTRWERWTRLFMGMRPSPYNAIRYFYWAEEIARGPYNDPKSACRFDKVVLNIPGDPDYDPTQPWLMKWNAAVDRIAGDICTFVDDLRAAGYSIENAWAVARQFASRLQYLGIQDAPQKRQPPIRTPNAWSGTVQVIEPTSISKTVTQEKWDKARRIVQERAKELSIILQDLRQHLPLIVIKQLEKDTGFLVHLAITFPSIMPFLKGFYLTMNSWRSDRKSDGWKMGPIELDAYLEDKGLTDLKPDDLEDRPEKAVPVPRLFDDVRALNEMFKSPIPPRIAVRSTKVLLVFYGFGDASGKGFGSTFDRPHNSGVSYRIGVWRATEETESSNWKEFANVVESLECEVLENNLRGVEIFFFTDNSTVEACLYKGTSTSPKLLDLIIRLRSLELRHSLRIHVSHVSGKRMIAEGADGVSRGILNEGVMSGHAMLEYICPHKGAHERSPSLVRWVRQWSQPHPNGHKFHHLSPVEWFERAHDIVGWFPPNIKAGQLLITPRHEPGVLLWTPPPGVADVALEELRKARHKRQDSTHIFVCPRLFTPRWLKQLHKVSDIVFEVPAGSPMWPSDMFEPLLIGICFPFIRCQPWQLRGTPKMYSVGRELRSLFKGEDVDVRPVLRQFCLLCWRAGTMSADVVSRVLYFQRT